jgi:hypothetical protein
VRVTRSDRVGRLDKASRTPTGGVRVPAYVTRVGVLTYRNPDGTSVRELRHPDEVFKADSLASLSGAAVTVGHPGRVNASNWKRHAVGQVAERVEPAEDKFVGTSLLVQDEAAIADVDAGKLVELSCGYDCDIVAEKGEYAGEKYDARQVNIVYNHVALLPVGGGRAGNDVRLRLDGEAYDSEGGYTSRKDMELEKKIAELVEANASLKVRADSVDGLQAKVDHLSAENETLKSKVAELSKQDRFDAAVDQVLKLREGARKVLGAEFKFDGKSKRDVMVEAVTKCDSKFKADGLSDDYVQARFDMAVASTVEADKSASVVTQVIVDTAKQDADDPIAAATKRNLERSKNAYKGEKK